jgi:hypothetical protein
MKEFEVTINTSRGDTSFPEYEHLNKKSLENEYEYNILESNAMNSMSGGLLEKLIVDRVVKYPQW